MTLSTPEANDQNNDKIFYSAFEHTTPVITPGNK